MEGRHDITPQTVHPAYAALAIAVAANLDSQGAVIRRVGREKFELDLRGFVAFFGTDKEPEALRFDAAWGVHGPFRETSGGSTTWWHWIKQHESG